VVRAETEQDETQDPTNWAHQQQQQNEKNIIKADDVDQHARYRRVVGYWS